MAITLNAITLPQGLRWTDEFAWSPAAISSIYSVTGALIVQKAVKQAGRPITLVGGAQWAWLTRTEALALQALLDAGNEMTLTLHDARTFTVLPANDDALDLSALPIVNDSGPADPSAGARYVLESLKLIEV